MTIEQEDDLESLQIEAERLGNFYFEAIKGEYSRDKEEASDSIYKEWNIVRCKIARLKYPKYPNHSELEAKLVEKEKQDQEDAEFLSFINNNNGEEVGPPGELVESTETIEIQEEINESNHDDSQLVP